MKSITFDNIISQIPNHILNDYPMFFEFLAAYYEWLAKDKNHSDLIKNHMEYLDFKDSIDEYVNFMKQEYLSDIPDNVLLDKELFIKWSKKFNLIRGSHESYKFLFRLLFNEQNVEIYTPKENILKTSDGNWISGESIILLTYSPNNTNDFLYRKITQTIPIYNDIVEESTAIVQNVRTRYIGNYVVTELSVANIIGNFKMDYPVVSETGKEEWIIPSVTETFVTSVGSGYQNGQRIFINSGYDTFNIERQADIDDIFDLRLTTILNKSNLIVEVDSVVLSDNDYNFDGRIINASAINVGSDVVVTLPTYKGYIVVDETSDNNSIFSLNILESSIGSSDTNLNLFSSGLGSGFTGYATVGTTRSVKGYYQDTKGHLSSNMYLQDSFFYQNYSYSIKTQQDFTSYADIVKNVLHPAGFALFGQLNYIELLQLILNYVDEDVYASTKTNILHKNGLGPNYKFFNTSIRLDQRLYSPTFITNLDQDNLNGEVGYNLESEFLSQHPDYEYLALKGWMNKSDYNDLNIYIPQEYTDEDESANEYFENGYVAKVFV